MAGVGVAVRGVVGVGLEDALHPESALVGPIVLQEVANLRDRRDAAGQVEVDAPEELGVVSHRGGLDVLVPGGANALVNLGRQRFAGGFIDCGLKRSAQSRCQREG